MDFINYAALDLSKKEQFGSDKTVSSNQELKDFDYTDGLSKKEFEKIDKNKDGAISEEEFKAAFGGDSAEAYKSYWNSYKSFYNATSKSTNSGTQTTTVKEDGTVVTSLYDKNGNLTKYYEKKENDLGIVSKITYEYKNGESVAISEVTTNPNGTSTTKNLQDGSITTKNVDGTSCTYDKNGKLTKIKTDAFSQSEAYSFKYNSDGNIASAKVNGKTYTNIVVKDNSTTIKDSKGNVIAKLTTDGKGSIYFTEYSNGKKSKRVEINSDGLAENVCTYDKNGKLASKFFCSSGNVRKYTRDKSGNLLKSSDYVNGKLHSEQTYSDKTEKDVYGDACTSDKLWKSKTVYDENGNVKSYITYDYTKKDGNVVQTTTYYGADKKTKEKSVVKTLDGYKNPLSSVTYDSQNKEVSRTTYEYDTVRNKRLTNSHISSKTIEKDNETVVKKYDDGVMTEKNVVTVSNGIASASSYYYKYYSNGNTKEEKVTTDDSVNVSEYDKDGNKTSSKVDLYSLVKSKYPNLNSSQLKQLIKKCVRDNNLSGSNALVTCNDGKYDINIPEFQVGDDNYLEFI